jgi:regulator of replication initiation timing
LEFLTKKYQTEVEERVNVLMQENINLKIQLESLNAQLNQYKTEEKEQESSAKEDISMERINQKLGDMNVRTFSLFS